MVTYTMAKKNPLASKVTELDEILWMIIFRRPLIWKSITIYRSQKNKRSAVSKRGPLKAIITSSREHFRPSYTFFCRPSRNHFVNEMPLDNAENGDGADQPQQTLFSAQITVRRNTALVDSGVAANRYHQR